ncbi:inositol monophosphatase family protein [Streptomyces fuscigenes]|uniref:inositol monophosphatase family protein n=1 Tax=Streptomyces fuscigenes TaxID=1528880 RepID=UPI001F24B4E1|nr:inositol monophosphatase family protein [Streptomyces fuscigenes]MCF3962074.1 inositol monophosphatase [Streptomyces fuscigenes]
MADETAFRLPPGARVEAVIKAAADAEIMPRYRRLSAEDISEKSGPHDLVTVADRRAEEYLTRELTSLVPGSVVVGEEAVAADPGVYGALDGDAPVWIVDPVDGTRVFISGAPGFCTLVSLARYGEVLASWTYAPVTGSMAVAVRGRGAHLDGRPLRPGPPEAGRPLRMAMSHPDFTSDEQKRALLGLDRSGAVTRGSGSAGLDYLAVATGELDAVAYNWEYAWDHAAGLLLVTEAGGAHLTLSGEPYRITGGNALPFTAARTEATARHVRRLLLNG